MEQAIADETTVVFKCDICGSSYEVPWRVLFENPTVPHLGPFVYVGALQCRCGGLVRAEAADA